eukprot:NODE_82_length_22625_cov_0.476516.p13 type:complete len:140 gc:universal NODE_82_length_22625_cov_0.476516:14503-14922(+)
MSHQASAQLGGKGTVRRKVRRQGQPNQDQHKQIASIMQKLGASQIQQNGQVNLYKDDGKVLTSNNPTVNYAQQGHVFSISGGNWSEKTAQEVQPDILEGMNPESIAALQKLAESYQNTNQMKKDVEDVPDLVEDANQLD